MVADLDCVRLVKAATNSIGAIGPVDQISARTSENDVDIGQNSATTKWTTEISPCFHLPGFHFGVTLLLTPIHVSVISL